MTLTDELDDPAATAADRQDNRRAITVAVIGVLIVLLASGIRMAVQSQAPQYAVPQPTPRSSVSTVHSSIAPELKLPEAPVSVAG